MERSKNLEEALERFAETVRRRLRPSRSRFLDPDERRDEWEREAEQEYLKERAALREAEAP